MISRQHSRKVWGVERTDTGSPLIQRVRNAIAYGASKEECRDLCLRSGQSEVEAYFTYKAAELLLKSEEVPECAPTEREVG